MYVWTRDIFKDVLAAVSTLDVDILLLSGYCKGLTRQNKLRTLPLGPDFKNHHS